MKKMNKNITLLLIVFSFISFKAHAFTFKTSGVAHISVDSINNGTDTSTYLASSSSRLAFSATHPINKSLNVLMQYETGVDFTGEGSNDGNGSPTNQDGQLFTRARDSYVGLEGGLGTILLGHHSSADIWINEYNLFADQVADIGNLWAGSGLPGRQDNMIFYSSPKHKNGFDFSLAYVPEEGTNNTDSLIVKPVYQHGNLRISGAYASFGKGVGKQEHTATALNVIYNSTRFNIGLGIQNESDIAGVAGSDRETYSIGSQYKINDSHSIKVQYTVTEGTTANTDASMVGLGYDYHLDKDTNVYFAYGSTDNDAAANFQANGKGHGNAVTPAIGQDPSAVSIGIVYKFDLTLLKK